MNTITRLEKLQHAEDNLSKRTGFLLNERAVDRMPEFQDNDFPLHALEADVPRNSKLEDFTTWLHNDPHAHELSEGGATLRQALPAYRTAVLHKLAKMKEWQHETNDFLSTRLQELAEAGHIPEILVDRLQTRQNAAMVDVKIVDSSVGEDKAAFYVPDEHVVYLRPWLNHKAFVSTMTHEAFHGLSGTSVKQKNDRLFTSRLGLGTNVVGDNGYISSEIGKHRAINEGVTEYLRNLVHYGKPGEISADRRGPKHDTRSYTREREIVQILADRIGLDAILKAYAEDYVPGTKNTLENTREFIHLVRKTYGPGFLQKLDKLDQEEGPERALLFVKAADYVAGNKYRARSVSQKVGSALGINNLKN